MFTEWSTSCVVLDLCKVRLMMVHGNKMHYKTNRNVIVSSIKYFNGPYVGKPECNIKLHEKHDR